MLFIFMIKEYHLNDCDKMINEDIRSEMPGF